MPIPQPVATFAADLMHAGHTDLERLSAAERARGDALHAELVPLAFRPNFWETIELLLGRYPEAEAYWNQQVLGPVGRLTIPGDRPWMTALEMQFAAMRNAQAERTTALSASAAVMRKSHADGMGFSGAMRNAHAEGVAGAAAWRHLRLLRTAETYAWGTEAGAAVWQASKTIPGTATLDRWELSGPSAWWWFGDVLPIAPYWRSGGPIVALLFGLGSLEGLETPSVNLNTFVMHKEGLGPIGSMSWTWDFGESLDEMLVAAMQRPAVGRFEPDLDAEAVTAIVAAVARTFLAACVWLRHRVVTVGAGPVERHRRKQLAREHEAPLPADVKVVELRRRESASRPPSAGGDPVDWSCRWVVSGHWRMQPYKDRRELIPILPYVKGPDDKPLRVPRHTVYAVRR